MSEYHYILSLYKEYKNQPWKTGLFALGALAVASFLTALNLFRISPFVYYLLAMGATLYYEKKNHFESNNYTNLKEFLQSYDPSALLNEERLFFMDYQLKAYFDGEVTELFKHLNDKVEWNDEKAIDNLKKIISEIASYYDYLTKNSELDQNIEISLQVYTNAFENKKKDLV